MKADKKMRRTNSGSGRIADVERELSKVQEKLLPLLARHEQEQQGVKKIQDLKQKIEDLTLKKEHAERNAHVLDRRDPKRALFLQKAAEARDEKRTNELEAERQKFADEHKDEIDAYNDWKAKQDAGVNDYGGESDSGSNKEEKPAPTLPEFNEKEFLEKWDEEFPAIEMGELDAVDIDNDWILTEEEI